VEGCRMVVVGQSSVRGGVVGVCAKCQVECSAGASGGRQVVAGGRRQQQRAQACAAAGVRSECKQGACSARCVLLQPEERKARQRRRRCGTRVSGPLNAPVVLEAVPESAQTSPDVARHVRSAYAQLRVAAMLLFETGEYVVCWRDRLKKASGPPVPACGRGRLRHHVVYV